MLVLLRPNEAVQSFRTVSQAARFVALLQIEHKEFCNLYTISSNAIIKKVVSLYNRFRELVRWRKDRIGSKDIHGIKMKNKKKSLTSIMIKESTQREQGNVL
jgi:hypothetical protein